MCHSAVLDFCSRVQPETDMNTSIAFIGGGNMAASLIGGLRQAGCSADNILVAEPDAGRRQRLQSDHGVRTSADNSETLQQDIVVLAVKPQILQPVCRQLQQASDDRNPTFVSIAAGVRCQSIDNWLGGGRAIVRCMPNTPALLQCGATGMFANAAVDEAAKARADTILSSVGITVWVDNEDLLDSITAVSGSGPAYFFLMMEAMAQTGEQLGLDSDTARRLVGQTALGAARMVVESELDAATLRANVTSKGGTTEQAILSFEQAGFRDMVKQALTAARQRSVALANELANQQE